MQFRNLANFKVWWNRFRDRFPSSLRSVDLKFCILLLLTCRALEWTHVTYDGKLKGFIHWFRDPLDFSSGLTECWPQIKICIRLLLYDWMCRMVERSRLWSLYFVLQLFWISRWGTAMEPVGQNDPVLRAQSLFFKSWSRFSSESDIQTADNWAGSLGWFCYIALVWTAWKGGQRLTFLWERLASKKPFLSASGRAYVSKERF